MCLGVAWLQARCLFKCCLCLMDIAGLQQYKPEVIVSLGKVRIASHQIAKDIGCGSGIVVLSSGPSPVALAHRHSEDQD